MDWQTAAAMSAHRRAELARDAELVRAARATRRHQARRRGRRVLLFERLERLNYWAGVEGEPA